MNIFASSDCPIESARFLDNKRVIKMILESAQMLSTAIIFHGGIAPYKRTHVNHPCSIWTRQNRANYLWLYNHYYALCKVYTERYGKIHKCENYAKVFLQNADKLPEGERQKFPNCTTYKDITDTYLAYKLYLNDKWDTDKIEPKWS
jgi:hypothetical protein